MKLRLFFFIMLAARLCDAQIEMPFHRALEDREITYWLLDPATHQFRFSHDFNIDRVGQKYAHSFVRKGSKVSNDIIFIDLDTGERLNTKVVSGKEVNALGYYEEKAEDDDVVVQGELLSPVPEGGTVRIRVMETYTDEARYRLDGEELFWDRTFGRPWNRMVLPKGWKLVSCSYPSMVEVDSEDRIVLTMNNHRSDELHIIVRARKR